MKIIALSGYKQSGKDLAASIMMNNHNFVRYSFADRLKDSVAREFNILRHVFDKPELKESPLFSMPVAPTDAFSLNICRFMKNEFVTIAGNKLPTDLLDPWEDYKIYWTPRALLILKGSAYRAVDSGHWVLATIRDMGLETRNVAITDLRYRSELAILKDRLGSNLVSVRINRFDTSTSTDPSEIDLDSYNEFDYIIENRGSKDQFVDKVEKLTKEILNERV